MEVPVPESRRRLLVAMFGTAGVFAVQPLLFGLQAPAPASGSSPRAKVYPNGRDPNLGPQTDEPSKVDPKAIKRANQEEFKSDVAKLYALVSDLKAQIEKTDVGSVYSLSVLKQAQQIEKLAKQIKSLAKG
jgi:hypothetical protein